jgi:F-type H+-transporting ATPase subunit b
MDRRTFSHLLIGALVFIVLMSFSLDVSAMAGISEGRRLWDNVMLWVNFGILVFLFLRYGKKPLTDFLAGEKTKIEKTLDAVSHQLGEAESRLEAEQGRLRDIEGQLQEVRGVILELGQKEKGRVLEKARIAAAQMIEDAHGEFEYRLAAAKKALKDEMIDIAVSIVEGKLRARISSQDNDILLNQFLSDLKTSGGYFE